MSRTQAPFEPSAGVRRLGYLATASANAFLLWLLHVWPEWDAFPVLTADTPQVLGVVNASLVAGIVVSLVHLVADPGWLTPAGVLVTTAFGLASTVVVLRVFPFDFGTGSGWATVARVLLVIGIVGSVIGLLATAVSLMRMLTVGDGGPGAGQPPRLDD